MSFRGENVDRFKSSVVLLALKEKIEKEMKIEENFKLEALANKDEESYQAHKRAYNSYRDCITFINIYLK